MPFKSKEEQDREIKQSQDMKVNDLLNRSIPNFHKSIKRFLQVCEPKRDEMAKQMDALYDTEEAKNDCKKAWKEWNTICKLWEENNAVIFFIEQFEAGFREEWKGKKKGSLENRKVYLKAKRKEFRALRRDHVKSVRANLKKVDIIIGKLREEDTTDEEDGEVQEEVPKREEEGTGAETDEHEEGTEAEEEVETDRET